MKKYVLSIISCALSVSIVQSQTIQISSSNPQQAAQSLLGGSCVNISNIQFTGANQSIGAYVDANGTMGLTQGVLISSGVANDAEGPNNSASSGVDLGYPGDPSLSFMLNSFPDTFGNGFYTTYDAAILEFDFTSQVDDSVFVKYVFASEEYPEFVGSSFNDVFAFFVSGPGITGEQNIAVVPGTNVPVAINLLNIDSYPGYYIDNDSGTYTQYDAYTIPLYSKFYAQAGNTYHIKLMISDAGDGIYDSGVFLESFPLGSNNISGYINHQGQPATAGTVTLYEYNTDSTLAPVIASQNIGSNGFYSFSNLPIGDYIVKAELDQNVYPNTFPKYYVDAITWDSATTINIPCANYSNDVELLVLAGGPGEITGHIGQSTDVQKSTLKALAYEGADVYLTGTTDGLIYRYSKSDETGMYKFENIPLGNYNIVVDVPGMYMELVRKVAVTGSELIYDQDYFVGEKLIYATDVEIVEPLTEDRIALFPSPVIDNLTFKIDLLESSDVNLQIMDCIGRIVMQLYKGDIGKGYSTINTDVSSFAPGIYVASLTVNGKAKTVKFVKN